MSTPTLTAPAPAGDSDVDDVHLARALTLALRSPLPDPNPRVGCLLVSDGAVVGEGWHHGAGTPHAEVEALRSAGTRAAGATAYVSLEPCDHHGRTGPCSVALLQAGVTRVVYGQADPNPTASGGAARLAEAGVAVGRARVGQAEAINPAWTFSVTHGRPFVTWKVAATLDGRTAAADGTSRWITGPDARADVHRLRAECGAIVVGTGTVLADDPALTVRTPEGRPIGRQPLRVVVGSRVIPADARVRDAAAPSWFIDRPPAEVLAGLHARGVHHAWLEGGAGLAASFVAAGLVDEIVVYLAGRLLGAGTPLLADLGVRTLADAPRLALTDVARLGDDVRLTYRMADDKE